MKTIIERKADELLQPAEELGGVDTLTEYVALMEAVIAEATRRMHIAAAIAAAEVGQ